MKRAILSMQKIVNFGSVLQAYSLKTIIENITGETPAFIDIDYSDSVRRAAEKPKDNAGIETYKGKGLKEGLKRKVFRKLRKANEKKIQAFMIEELGVDDKYNNEHFDCVIVGSDEVFNNTHDKRGLSLQLYGNVKQADKVIAYAAAAGTAKYEDIPIEDIDRVKNALCNFSAMSVRDDSTMEYISKLYSGTIEHHLDPVLVGPLDKRVHKKVFLKKYMVVYSYNERIRSKAEIEAIRSFAKKNKLKTLAIGGIQFWCDYYIPLSPFRVLDYFYGAECIVTDTFHGTIFSIVNRKRFATIVRPSNREKLTGLLKDLCLSDRRVYSLDDLGDILSTQIDYAGAEKAIEESKRKTMDYLRQNI